MAEAGRLAGHWPPEGGIAAKVIATPKARERVVQVEELRRLFRLLEGVRTSAQVRGAFRLLLLTLCRASEVVEATWDEFDLDGALWSIPAERMKMGRPHLVPLARESVRLLRRLRELSYGSRYVFPSQHTKMDKPVARVTLNATLYEIERREREAGRSWERLPRTICDARAQRCCTRQGSAAIGSRSSSRMR